MAEEAPQQDSPDMELPELAPGTKVGYHKMRHFFNALRRVDAERRGERLTKNRDELHIDIRELNDRHFLVSEAGRATIMTEMYDETMNRVVLDRSTVADFRTFYRNREVAVGKRFIKLGDFWLDHADRRQYARLVFNPDPDYAPDDTIYNLWRGWSVDPTHGDWSLFKAHLRNVGAAGDDATYEFILDWLAWLVQRPHLPAGTALVWRGRQGSGKSFIAKMVGRLCGQHFVHVTSSKHLVGNFNAHLRDALLLFADEAFWAGDKQGEGVLKTLVTETMLMIEGKHRDAVNMPNRCHIMMATNSEWAVPVGHDDRRYAVIEVPDTFVGDRAYFDAIEDQMVKGGLAAMLWDLLHRYVKRSPMLPRSAAALQNSFNQKLYTMSPIHRWWYEKLENGVTLQGERDWLLQVEKSKLHADYLKAATALNFSRRSSETELGLALRELVPGVGQARRESVMGGRQMFWTFPALDVCRKAFSDFVRLPWLFEEPAED